MAGDAEREVPRIAPLSAMKDLQIVGDDPDPRGWDVVDAGGRVVGVVRDLLVDREVMRVRYLEVELAGGGRRTLLPVGTAQLDDDTDRVLFHELTPAELERLPAYDQASFSREYEESVLTSFGAGGGGAIGSGGYAGRQFDDGSFFAKRRNKYGGMGRGERIDEKLTRE